MIRKIGKFLATLFLIYISWYYGAIGPDNRLLYGLAIGATFFVALDLYASNADFRSGLYSLVPMFCIFAIYSLLSELLVAVSKEKLVSSLITYFAYVVLCFNVCYISCKEKSAEWVLTGFTISAILCAVQTIFRGVTYINSGVEVLTMGPKNNPNSLGLSLLFGIFGVVNSKNYSKHFYRTILLVAVFLYVIMLTGSRKCFISGLAMIAGWMVVFIRQEMRMSGGKKSLGRMLVLVSLAVVVLIYYSKNFEGTSMYMRLMDSISNNQADQNRLKMYRWAVDRWKNSPVFGIGFDQYRMYYGVYSHSSYAELLASSGVIGCFIWLSTLWKKTAVELRSMRCASGDIVYHTRVNMLMFAVELIIGIGQIWFYEYTHMLMLTFIFMYGYIAKLQKKDTITKELKQNAA